MYIIFENTFHALVYVFNECIYLFPGRISIPYDHLFDEMIYVAGMKH